MSVAISTRTMRKPKTSFKKSHGGCKRCKSRKVKCNEARPTCSNCHRHAVPCEYPLSRLAAQLPDQRHLNGHDSAVALRAASSDSDSPFESIQRRQLELQLMHHFITVVGPGFPSSSLQLGRGLWTVDAVRLAFGHDFLLNAIFAIAALHLVRGIPDSPRFMDDSVQSLHPGITKPGIDLGGFQSEIDLAKVHSIYLDLAVKQQRKAVADITPQNANALVFASILISYQGLKLLPSGPESMPRQYHPPVQWLRMVRGITDVSGIAGRIGRPEPVIPYLLRVSGEPNFGDDAAFFNPANREKFQHLLHFGDMNEPDDPGIKEAYEKAVAYIGRMANDIQSKQLPRVIFRLVLGFAVLMPSKFIDCVEIGRPRALIILAHYFAMAKAVDDHWIFAGLARREVVGLRGMVPLRWQSLLDWPLRISESSPLDMDFL